MIEIAGDKISDIGKETDADTFLAHTEQTKK